jgi:TolA-binding protein
MTANYQLTVMTDVLVKTLTKAVTMVITTAALVSCASPPVINEDPTIQQLATRAAKIEPSALPKMSREDVRRTYESLASSTNNKALKAIALQRLADLELESENEKIATEAESPHLDGGTKPSKAPAVMDEKKRGSAIHQYERLLELYPEYKGNDKVLYQLGRAYELDGNLEKTLVTLTTLVNKYPNQNNRDELQFRRGEILFVFKEFEQAERAYQDVIKAGEVSPYYERAIFKHGWSVFKQGDTKRSLKSYFTVLDRSFAGGRKISDFSRSELELLGDTLRIVSLSFSYLKGVDSVGNYFKRIGRRDYEFHIYEHLGELYIKQGRVTDAANTFFKFVEWFPNHRQSPLFLVRLIDIYKQSGHTRELLLAKADLVTVYGIGAEFWKNHDEQLLDEFRPHIKKNLDDLTAYYHARAQKSKAKKDYRTAAHWYRTYVNSFPDDPSTSSKNMLLAESLLDSGDISSAAIEFENTAYRYPGHKKSAEAGYAALLAHRKQTELLKGSAKIKQRRVAIFSGKRFVTTFPNDKRAVNVMSKAAEELLALKDYKNAVGTAHHVASNMPAADKKLLLINWAIIAEAEFELGRYPQAEIASLNRLQLAGKKDKDKKKHTERLAAAIYKQGEQSRSLGQHRVKWCQMHQYERMLITMPRPH